MINLIEKARAIDIPEFAGVKNYAAKFGGTSGGFDSIAGMITDLTNLAVNFAGIFAFIMFLLGAFTLTFSNGVDANIEKGKKTLLWSVLGLVIIASAKLILLLIDDTLNK